MCVIRSKSEKTESSDTMGNTKITEPELDLEYSSSWLEDC